MATSITTGTKVLVGVILAGVAGLAYWAFKPAEKKNDDTSSTSSTGNASNTGNAPDLSAEAGIYAFYGPGAPPVPVPTKNEKLDAFMKRVPSVYRNIKTPQPSGTFNLVNWINANATTLVSNGQLPSLVVQVDTTGTIVDQSALAIA